MGTTASCLARAFGIVIRQIADLLTMMHDYKTHAPNLPRLMEITYQDAISLQVKEINSRYEKEDIRN